MRGWKKEGTEWWEKEKQPGQRGTHKQTTSQINSAYPKGHEDKQLGL